MLQHSKIDACVVGACGTPLSGEIEDGSPLDPKVVYDFKRVFGAA